MAETSSRASAAGRCELDRSAVVDGPGERQKRHGCRWQSHSRCSSPDRSLKTKLVCRQALWTTAIEGNRLALPNRDDRIAIAVRGESWPGRPRSSKDRQRQSDPPCHGASKLWDRGVAYRGCAVSTNMSLPLEPLEVVVAGDRKDGAARSIGFDIAGDHRERGASGRVGPRLRYLGNETAPALGRGRRDGERRYVGGVCTDQVPLGLARPPRSGSNRTVLPAMFTRSAQVICRICQAQIDGLPAVPAGARLCSTETVQSHSAQADRQECRWQRWPCWRLDRK